MLLASLTHLADVGISAYTEDLCSCSSKISRVFRGGLILLPGLVFPPPTGFADPGLLRDLAVLLDWSKSVSKVGGRGVVIEHCFDDPMARLKRTGTGAEQANNGARLQLPVSIRMGGTRKWDTREHTGLKAGVGPLAPGDVIAVVNTLLNELHLNLGFPLLTMPGLYGTKNPVSVTEKVVILAGASHMRRTAEALRHMGIQVKHVETAHWRATKKEVQQLLARSRRP
jgi:hypothetical protein